MAEQKKEFKVVWSNDKGVFVKEMDVESEAAEFYTTKTNEKNIKAVDLYHLAKSYQRGLETDELQVGDIIYNRSESNSYRNTSAMKPLAIYVVDVKLEKINGEECFSVRGVPIAKNGVIYYKVKALYSYTIKKVSHDGFEVNGWNIVSGKVYKIQKRNVAFNEVCSKEVVLKMNPNLKRDLAEFLPIKALLND